MNAKIGHNSATDDQLKEHVANYIQCDQKSQELSDSRAEIREKVEELGVPSKAFQDAVSRAKKDRRKKEGYDEGLATMTRVLGDMDQDDLFSYMDKREEAKAAQRAEQKAKADAFKKAEDRAPKDGKVVSTKSIGEQQADAIAKAPAAAAH